MNLTDVQHLEKIAQDVGIPTTLKVYAETTVDKWQKR